MKKISISIVTYNSSQVIGECLQSLLAYTDTATVFIVDNNSEENAVDILRSYADNDRINLIQAPRNLGFGKAHNMVIREIDSDYHVLCNPDIVINGETIAKLADYMDKHADIGILCPKFLNADGSLQPNNHRLPTLSDLTLRRFAPMRVKQYFKAKMDAYLMLDVGYELPCDVPFVSGAFMFCRTKVLQQVQGFDPRYFLYFEDADISRKIQVAGFRTAYCPDAVVIHHWERAAYKSWRMTWIMVISAIRYFNKWGYQIC